MTARAAQTEMRIGLNTSAFGSVQVRTVVHANDVGLTIGSEKGDLRSLLANDLPGITSSLLKQDLKLGAIDFQHGMAFSNNLFSGNNQQQHQSQQRFQPPVAAALGLMADTSADIPNQPATMQHTSPRTGLSILA